MPIRIIVTYQDDESYREYNADKILIGRPDKADLPALDLSPDACVSRQHALLQIKDGVCWISDLGSKFGTQVDGREIRSEGEWRLFPENNVVIGETTLRFIILGAPKAPTPAVPARPAAPAPAKPAVPALAPTPQAAPQPKSPVGRDDFHFVPNIPASPQRPQPTLQVPPAAAPAPLAPSAPSPVASPWKIVQMIDTNRPLSIAPSAGSTPGTAEQRLAMLIDLPRQFSSQSNRNDLLQAVMKRVAEVIPSAKRGALLLRDPQQDTLLLKAYVSANEPAVSETLARRAMNEKHGILWRSGENQEPSQSMREHNIVTGLYAPLQWQDRVFGVICVDSPQVTDTFREEDLQFLIAIGQYAGMAMSVIG